MFAHGSRVLVIAPHPDDETLGCGGTIARLAQEGADVYVLAITVGDLPQIGAHSPTNVRTREFQKACESLGVRDREIALIGHEYHMRLDQYPRSDLVRLIEAEARLSLRHVDPDVLFIPASGSFNHDHVACHEAAFAAARLHAPELKPVPSLVLGYRIPDEVWTCSATPAAIAVDITRTAAVKLDALSCYSSQMRNDRHPRSVSSVSALDRANGVRYGVALAEQFVPYRFLI